MLLAVELRARLCSETLGLGGLIYKVWVRHFCIFSRADSFTVNLPLIRSNTEQFSPPGEVAR